MASVAPWFRKLFQVEKPVIGVIHLEPLPGSPRARSGVEQIEARALEDAERYLSAGLDGLIVENFGDVPFPRDASPPHVIALMARIATAVKQQAGSRPVGVNLLRNDSLGALGVAVAAGLDFIRVNVLAGAALTDQGIIEGQADLLLRERRRLDSGTRILADFRVKHATGLRQDTVPVEVDELLARAGADGLLVTGGATGQPAEVDTLRAVAAAAGRAPVLVASGVTPDSLVGLFPHADGFIVGTSLKQGGRTTAPVDPERARAMRDAARKLRRKLRR